MHKLLYFPIGNYYNYNIETYTLKSIIAEIIL